MKAFKAKIEIIGINLFVFLPDEVLTYIFHKAGKDKGAIPVILKIAGHSFLQNLVRYKGEWRLYINGPMLKAEDKNVGNEIQLSIDFDANERITEMHPKLEKH